VLSFQFFVLVIGSVSDKILRWSARSTLNISAYVVVWYFWLILFVQISQVCVGIVQDSSSGVVDFFLSWKIRIDSDDRSCIQVSVKLIVSNLLPD
jgi:hypothetical protein